MSGQGVAYPPPNSNFPIFDSSSFISVDNQALTIESGKQYFLSFPTAQGTETLAATNVGGDATFYANLIMDGIGNYLEFPDGTQQTTAGGGGTGDAVLSATQTFSGVNSFNNAGGIVLENTATTATTTSIFQYTDNNLHINSSVLGGGVRISDTSVGATLSVNSNGLAINKGLQLGNTTGANIVQMVADATTNNQLDITGNLSVSNNLLFPTSSSLIILNNSLQLQNSNSPTYNMSLTNSTTDWTLAPVVNPLNFNLNFGGMSITANATFINLNATSSVGVSNILTTPGVSTINATNLGSGRGTFYVDTQTPYFAYNNAGAITISSLITSTNLTNYALLTTGTNNFTNTNTFSQTPTTSATQTYPLANSQELATITYVNNAVASGANTTYTQVFTGNFNSGSNITIPTGCVGFTCAVIGTGGTPLSYSVGVPDSSHYDYYYQIPATAGGAQVSVSNARICIPKQGTYLTSTLQIFTNVAGVNGGTVSRLVLNGNSLAEATNGNSPANTSTAGTGTSGTPYSNPNYIPFTTFQGGGGQGNSQSYTTVNVGQLGGGNIGGGIAGFGQSGSTQNQYGAGGLWGSLGGPSYGMPIPSASPITYGGCIITWFI